ncbi:MAG: YceI family protein [Bacteroidales bacterium]|nr:YceI family protein [Bacteroidales bacterium]
MKKNLFLFVILLLASAGIFAQQAVYLARKSKVSFQSDAPLELIKASSTKLQGAIDVTKRTFAFSIPTDSFKGFNSPLQQEHFYENYIEAKAYPVSTFEGKIIEQVDLLNDGNYSVRAKGKLNIHGVEQERIIKVQLRISQGVIYAQTNFSVLLQDHNITIPKVVFQKIAEEIKVIVAVEFGKKQQ